MQTSEYEHTQKAPLYLLVQFFGVLMFFGAWAAHEEAIAISYLLAVVGVGMILLGFMFMHLRVRDEGRHLAVRFGPIPVFQFRFPYSEMRAVETGRSAIIDGWGIHWIPSRGWTYNLWGFTCVEIQYGSQRIRIGTDDAQGLREFLASKIQANESTTSQ